MHMYVSLTKYQILLFCMQKAVLIKLIIMTCLNAVAISVVNGLGHPAYPGHLGHILSGSSGSYPLH